MGLSLALQLWRLQQVSKIVALELVAKIHIVSNSNKNGAKIFVEQRKTARQLRYLPIGPNFLMTHFMLVRWQRKSDCSAANEELVVNILKIIL